MPSSFSHCDLHLDIAKDINHVLLDCPYAQGCWIHLQDQMHLECCHFSTKSGGHIV